MSRATSAPRLIRWAARRPRDAARLARTQSVWVVVTVSAALPRAVRRIVFRPLGAVAAAALHRRGDHGIAAPIRILSLHALGQDRQALGVADVIARRGGPRATESVARVVLAMGDARRAQRLLDAHPPDRPGAARAVLQGEVALAMGEYSAARDHAARAIASGHDGSRIRRVAERAGGELALLDPAWRPHTPVAPDSAVPRSVTPGRVVHLLTNSLPHRHAGYTVRAQQVASCQRAVGLDPVMVTRAGFPASEGVVGTAPVDVVDGIAYHRIYPDLPLGAAIDAVAEATVEGLVGLVGRLQPALLQPTTNYINAQVALAVGERTGVPVVYEVRGFLEETWTSRMGAEAEAGERYIAQRAIETDCMRRVAAIVTLSKTMREDIVARGGIDPDRVVVIPNAVDVDRFTPGPRDAALATTLGIAPDETVIGYISSFVPYEGIDHLVAAVADLRRRDRRVRLLLVGDGSARTDLEAQADRLGLRRDGIVIFTGRVPHADVERYYRTIDLFVVPRTADRVSRLVTPLKPYEAMVMAKAVIVSAVPALLEIVRDGETGRAFTPGDPAALADVLDALIDDPAARHRLGEAARTWVAANRTWAQNGQRYLELYRRLGVA